VQVQNQFAKPVDRQGRSGMVTFFDLPVK